MPMKTHQSAAKKRKNRRLAMASSSKNEEETKGKGTMASSSENELDRRDINAAFNLLHMRYSELTNAALDKLMMEIGEVSQERSSAGSCSRSPPGNPIPYRKILTKSDVNCVGDRLYLTREFVDHHVVPLLREEDSTMKGIPVDTYEYNEFHGALQEREDVQRRNFGMVLKNLGFDVSQIILCKGWRNYWEAYELQAERDAVDIQACRDEEGKLCILMTNLIGGGQVQVSRRRT